MTFFFYILIGCITFIAFLHAWSKKEFDQNRTIIINKPKIEVYSYVRQLKLQHFWFPYFEKRPGIVLKYKGDDGREGAALYWKIKHRWFEEEGIEKIIKVKTGKVLETQFFFLKPCRTYFISYIAVKEVGNEKTKILWGIRGVHRFPLSVFFLFYGFNGKLRAHIEEGLENLKFNLENR